MACNHIFRVDGGVECERCGEPANRTDLKLILKGYRGLTMNELQTDSDREPEEEEYWFEG